MNQPNILYIGVFCIVLTILTQLMLVGSIREEFIRDKISIHAIEYMNNHCRKIGGWIISFEEGTTTGKFECLPREEEKSTGQFEFSDGKFGSGLMVTDSWLSINTK